MFGKTYERRSTSADGDEVRSLSYFDFVSESAPDIDMNIFSHLTYIRTKNFSNSQILHTSAQKKTYVKCQFVFHVELFDKVTVWSVKSIECLLSLIDYNQSTILQADIKLTLGTYRVSQKKYYFSTRKPASAGTFFFDTSTSVNDITPYYIS